MKYTEDHMNEKPLFVIEEKSDVIEEQGEGETPVITIETSPDLSQGEGFNATQRPLRHWLWFVGGLMLSAIFCISAIVGCKFYRKYINIGVPVSLTS